MMRPRPKHIRTRNMIPVSCPSVANFYTDSRVLMQPLGEFLSVVRIRVMDKQRDGQVPIVERFQYLNVDRRCPGARCEN
jgi:hypothetical protein